MQILLKGIEKAQILSKYRKNRRKFFKRKWEMRSSWKNCEKRANFVK